MRICIYDDRRAADLGPLTATRPASDLLCGLTTLAEKQARYFRAESVGYLVRPELAPLLKARDPNTPVNDPGWLRAAPTVLVNSRWVAPPPPFPGPAYRDLFSGGTVVGVCGTEVAFASVGTDPLQAASPATIDDCVSDWSQALPGVEAGGVVVRRPWELVDLNPAQIVADFAACDPTATGYHPAGFAVVGPADRLFLHPTARIDPMVVADTTSGPVWIGPGAVVTAFTRLEGPCAVGPHTHVFGAKVKAGTTLGPHCRVGGEVEASVVLGYANKYHDGFLGHSYVGEWVNLAAATGTADLRCDYQPVTVKLNGEVIDTGRLKVGSVFGDHARTGLGVLLDAGTVVGPFAAVLPSGRLAPRCIPGFARTGPDGTVPMELDALFAAADRAMKRRGRELTPELRAVYATAAGHPDAPATLPLRRAAYNTGMSLPVRSLPVVQNWDCRGCAACCRSYSIPVTADERARIEAQNWDLGTPLFDARGAALNHRPDGACVFLGDDDRCRIHAKFGAAAKPLACRVYPFLLVPAGDHWRVGLRYACPSATANDGRPLDQHLSEAREYAALLEENEPAAKTQPPPPLRDGTVVPWDDVLRIVGVVARMLGEPGVPLERRWRNVLTLAYLADGLTFDGGGNAKKAVTGGRLSELFHVLSETAAEETPPADQVPPPGRAGRLVFRQVLAVYARKDHGAERGTAQRSAFGRVAAAVRFARGSGAVPKLHARLPDVPFAAGEQPFGPLPEECDAQLTRYYRLKVQSVQFCGPTNFGVPLWEGLRSLALTYPVLMWLARVFVAGGEGKPAAVERAVRVTDDNFGFNRLLGLGRQKFALRLLAARDDLPRLAAWYGQ